MYHYARNEPDKKNSSIFIELFCFYCD